MLPSLMVAATCLWGFFREATVVKSLLALFALPLVGWMAVSGTGVTPAQGRIVGGIAPEIVPMLQAAPAAPSAVAATPPGTKNPVKPTAESQAKAKKVYGYDCAMCHGDTGDGKTDLAKDVGPLTDLSDAKTLAGRPDAEIYDLIKNGKGKMPGEDGPRAKPDDLWNLVIYVRGLGKK